MHIHTLPEWKHEHEFFEINYAGEKSTRKVIILTVVMMVVEITAGVAFGSMALLADGWHMGTHAMALGITAFAYYYSRKHAQDPRYSFGTGKIGVLGGYTSAIFLGLVSIAMIIESISRLFAPLAIRFNQAILIAAIGLVVNIVSAVILHQGRTDNHHHDGHEHRHGHHDHNLRAAYLHVIADALTSFLAIFALIAGKYFGWIWMDPAMGIVGALVILKWAYSLLRDTGEILLDFNMSRAILRQVGTVIESDTDNRIADIHVWKIGSNQYAAIFSVVTHYPKDPQYYKDLLAEFSNLVHVTVEVHACLSEPCLPVSH